MIDEKILNAMRATWNASREDVRFWSRSDFDEFDKTLKALWRVARAAQKHICSSREGYPDRDEELFKALEILDK